MLRLLFTKTENAVWISHLDLMRLFQRAFKRAGLHLKHTQGFNPRPAVSIALPLSVGTASECELLDFQLEDDCYTTQNIKSCLNNNLVDGIQVLEAYENGRKIKDLSLLKCSILLGYDTFVTDDAAELIKTLFSRDSLIVTKKSKNGDIQQDIIPMIKKIDIQRINDHKLKLVALICCQNPTLNPHQIITAIENELPALKPSFSKCRRLEIFDSNENVFR